MYFTEKNPITQQTCNSGPHGLQKYVPKLKYYILFALEGTKNNLLLAGLPTNTELECFLGAVPVLSCLTGSNLTGNAT